MHGTGVKQILFKKPNQAKTWNEIDKALIRQTLEADDRPWWLIWPEALGSHDRMLSGRQYICDCQSLVDVEGGVGGSLPRLSLILRAVSFIFCFSSLFCILNSAARLAISVNIYSIRTNLVKLLYIFLRDKSLFIRIWFYDVNFEIYISVTELEPRTSKSSVSKH